MPLALNVTICSYRLGGTDGVSIEAEKWHRAFASLGCSVTTVAGSGTPDILIPGLAADSDTSLHEAEIERAFADADLVVVENLCSLPLNPKAGAVVANVLKGRLAILRHHDLASQRPQFAHLHPPPDWPQAIHVTINDLANKDLASHGIAATTIYNAFDPDPPLGNRDWLRGHLGLGPSSKLVLQPTRAILRKGIPRALELATALGATYWLLGPAEDGYEPELERALDACTIPVLRGVPSTATDFSIDDAYAACDVVAFPSVQEGFGNPPFEAMTHHRPVAVGTYLVGQELRDRFGFTWFDANDPDPIARFMAKPDNSVLDANRHLVREHFSLNDLPRRLASLVTAASTI